MEPAPQISTQPPELRSQDFEILREQGIDLIQDRAAITWTDHNLHDPGITLWEAICYAYTETGLRAGMKIADLIASSSKFTNPEFFSAAQVLPSAPVKLSDFQKLLVNHPLISNAWFFPLSTLPQGSLSALLEFSDDELNNNLFAQVVTPQQYEVEIAFPHWDEEDLIPFQEDVILQLVTFDGVPGDEWNKIAGSESYFARVSITYQPPIGAPQIAQVWIVTNILTIMEDPTADAPIILQEVLTIISTLGDNSPTDQTILKQLNRRVTRAYENMRLIRRYMSPYRNLCENFVEFNAVRLQEVSIAGALEVNSGVNIEVLLAEIFYRIFRMITPIIQFQNLDEQLQQMGSAEKVFDGPLTTAGFLTDDNFSSQQIIQTVYASDILRLIYQLRNSDDTDVDQREDTASRKIVAVRNLTLSNYLDNRPITTAARDCMRLVNSKNHVPRFSVKKSRLAVFRNGLEAAYDNDLVYELFVKKLENDIQANSIADLDLPIPQGETFPIDEFYPIQNDLPMIYGVGEPGLPETATSTRRAQARQLKGYMFLFEQMLAGTQAQLSAFNTFFSATPLLTQTLFQKDIYNIPEVAPLFKGYNPTDPLWWNNFRNDQNNSYMKILSGGLETYPQFLERRNNVLDHLLATLGESMADRTSLLLRFATQVPEEILSSFTDPTSETILYQDKQKLAALKELIYDKSSFYYDLPVLDRDKGQAGGNPIWRHPELVTIIKTGNQYQWSINNLLGNAIFESVSLSPSNASAMLTATEVMRLATRAENYSILIDGANRKLEIRNAPAPSSALATSTAIYATDPLATFGITDHVNEVINIWTTTTLTPLEVRLCHLLGIDLKERRPLVHDLNDYVEIFDAPDTGPLIEKSYRLWSDSGLIGNILLESVIIYEAATDPDAVSLAEDGVQLMIRYGIERGNYTIEENPILSEYRVTLLNPAGTIIARSEIYITKDDAEAAKEQTRLHILRWLSGQGFHLLENRLLFPLEETGQELIIPEQDDPYSFQLTIVLPSGYSRDFSVVNATPLSEQPVLYADKEFRKYVEEQIRKNCPAHILPRIIWADRIIPGNILNVNDPSFDAFEQAFLNWHALYVIDEIDETTLGPARDALTQITNALYQEYYSE